MEFTEDEVEVEDHEAERSDADVVMIDDVLDIVEAAVESHAGQVVVEDGVPGTVVQSDFAASHEGPSATASQTKKHTCRDLCVLLLNCVC